MSKKVLVGIIIILLLFIFSTQSHAVDHVIVDNLPNSDVVQSYKLVYDNNFRKFVYSTIYYAQTHNNTFPSYITTAFYDITHRGQNPHFNVMDGAYARFYGVNNETGQPIADDKNRFFLFYSFSNPNDESTYEVHGNANSSYTSMTQLDSSHYSTGVAVASRPLSNQLYLFSDMQMWLIDYFDGYIPADLFDIIYSIGNSSFDFDKTNAILNQIETNTNQANQEINDMNDFIQDDTVDNYSQNDLPQSNITDPTESTFNGIFNRLYTAISNDSYHSVTIPLKFGQWDKSFSLNSNSLDFMRGDRNRDLVAFIELIWSFIIYYYILRDIYNMVNDLSQGKIAEKVDNIKTQLL